MYVGETEEIVNSKSRYIKNSINNIKKILILILKNRYILELNHLQNYYAKNKYYCFFLLV